MHAQASDDDVFNEPSHMSCENFTFPVDRVGLPAKGKYDNFRFDKTDLQNRGFRSESKNVRLGDQEEEKKG